MNQFTRLIDNIISLIKETKSRKIIALSLVAVLSVAALPILAHNLEGVLKDIWVCVDLAIGSLALFMSIPIAVFLKEDTVEDTVKKKPRSRPAKQDLASSS